MEKERFRRGQERAQREYARIRSLYAEERVPEKLKTLVCTVCGRKRNVPESTPEEGFVCAGCAPSNPPTG